MSERQKLEPYLVYKAASFEDDQVLIDYLFHSLTIVKTGIIQKQQAKLGDKVTCYNRPVACRLDLTEKAYRNATEANIYYAQRALTGHFVTGYIINFIKPNEWDPHISGLLGKYYPTEFELRTLVNSFVLSSCKNDFVSYWLFPENSVMFLEQATKEELGSHLDKTVNKIGKKYASNV